MKYELMGHIRPFLPNTFGVFEDGKLKTTISTEVDSVKADLLKLIKTYNFEDITIWGSIDYIEPIIEDIKTTAATQYGLKDLPINIVSEGQTMKKILSRGLRLQNNLIES